MKWEMRWVLTVGTGLGLMGVLETFGLLAVAVLGLKLDQAQIHAFIYLKLAVAGHMTLFVAPGALSSPGPYPAPILLIAILATQCVAAMIVGWAGWWRRFRGFTWVWCGGTV